MGCTCPLDNELYFWIYGHRCVLTTFFNVYKDSDGPSPAEFLADAAVLLSFLCDSIMTSRHKSIVLLQKIFYSSFICMLYSGVWLILLNDFPVTAWKLVISLSKYSLGRAIVVTLSWCAWALVSISMLTLKAQRKIVADNTAIFLFFILFFKKIRFGIPCYI